MRPLQRDLPQRRSTARVQRHPAASSVCRRAGRDLPRPPRPATCPLPLASPQAAPRTASMMATRRGIRLPKPDIWAVALAIVFLAALALRLYGIDWDDGADLHPDELFIAKIVLIDRIRFEWPPDFGTLLDPARSGLNPRSADPVTGEFREFAYGALPLWVTDASAWVLSRLTGTDWNSMDHAYLVGRALSSVLSALTIVPVAIIGVNLGGRSVGLLAALFAALAPMSIQLAHFFTTDSWLTFFVALCLLACVTAARDGKAV